MIEMRWVWVDLKKDKQPPTGSLFVQSSLYQKLQYRYNLLALDASGAFCPSDIWSEWIDVPHKGMDC